jgi:hypothetical protein
MPSSSKSTITHPNHGSPEPADRSIEIGEGHDPYGATCFGTVVLLTGQNT